MAAAFANAGWKPFAAIGGSVIIAIVTCRLCCYTLNLQAGPFSVNMKPNEKA